MKKEDFFCHLGFFVVVLILFMLSVLLSPKNDITTKPSIFSEILTDLDEKVEVVHPQLQEGKQIIRQGHKNDDGVVCSRYLAQSALPISAFGVFTTKPITKGEIVFGESVALSIHGLDLSPHLIYMKHHSEYNNTIGGLGGSSITATRNIDAGEELFFNFEDYPQNFNSIYKKLHPRDPSEEDFQKADEITKKIIESVPVKTVELKPKKKKMYKQKKSKSRYSEKPVMDASPIFQLMKDSFKEYDKTLSNLLPESVSVANSVIQYGGTSMYIPKKQSVEWLIENGICVNGIELSKSLVYEREHGGVITRSVKKGEVITTSPMLGTINQNDPRCLKVNKRGSGLCFLSFPSKVNEGITASDCDEAISGDCPFNKANAFFQWSEFNRFNDDINFEAMPTFDSLMKV